MTADWDRVLNPFRYDEQGRLIERAAPSDTGAPAASAPPPPGPSLPLEIEALHRLQGDPRRLLAAFRDSLVLVPLDGERLWAARENGVLWFYAFSGEPELAAFLTARGELPAEGARFLRIHGRRLLEVAVPEADGPAGVALDVGGDRPMLFPPVAGIVPDAATVDTPQGAAR